MATALADGVTAITFDQTVISDSRRVLFIYLFILLGRGGGGRPLIYHFVGRKKQDKNVRCV